MSPRREAHLPRGFALRILVVVALAVGVTFGGMLWWTSLRDRERLDDAQRSRAQRTVELAHLLLQKRIEKAKSFARAVATSRAVQDAMEERNRSSLLAAMQPFGDEFASTLLVVDDEKGVPFVWSTPIAIVWYGRNSHPIGDTSTQPAAQLLGPDLGVVLEQRIEIHGTLAGRVRCAALIGRMFVQQTARDVEAPLAIFFAGEAMHYNLPDAPPPPPKELAPREVAFAKATMGGEPYDVAYRLVDGLAGDVVIAAGMPRGKAEASLRGFRWLIAGLGGGGLALVLIAVGGYMAVSAQRQRIEKQRDRALEQSAGLSDRLAHLAAVVHDIKAPVAGIELRCEGLLEDCPDDDTRAALGQIVETCDRLNLYLTNVLTAAQAEEGPIRMRRDALLVPGLVEEVAERLAPLALRRGVSLACEIDQSLPPVTGDHVFLERALTNLAANAIAATPAGGTVTLFARRDGEAIRCGAADDGPGFTEFDPAEAFSRERPRVKDSSWRSGNGLGLYIVARIAEAHGGRAVAANRAGGGAEVALVLPASGGPAA